MNFCCWHFAGSGGGGDSGGGGVVVVVVVAVACGSVTATGTVLLLQAQLGHLHVPQQQHLFFGGGAFGAISFWAPSAPPLPPKKVT